MSVLHGKDHRRPVRLAEQPSQGVQDAVQETDVGVGQAPGLTAGQRGRDVDPTPESGHTLLILDRRYLLPLVDQLMDEARRK